MSVLETVLLLLLVCLFDKFVSSATHDHHLGARGTEGSHNSASSTHVESKDAPLLMHCNVTGKAHQAAL